MTILSGNLTINPIVPTHSTDNVANRAMVMLDFDDTVVQLNTKSKFTDKKTGEVIAFTTEQLPLHDHLIGPGEDKPYDYRSDSFEEFDSPFFVPHMMEQLRQCPDKLTKMPCSELFAKSIEVNANDTAIISARSSSPSAMFVGIGRMVQALGIGGYMRKDRIHPCNYQKTGKESMAQSKLNVVTGYLDQVQKSSSKGVLPLLAPCGQEYKPMHLALYADDHPKTIATLKEGLHNELARWPDIKIVLWKVGEDETIQVLNNDGSVRMSSKDEVLGEVEQIYQLIQRDERKTIASSSLA